MGISVGNELCQLFSYFAQNVHFIPHFPAKYPALPEDVPPGGHLLSAPRPRPHLQHIIGQVVAFWPRIGRD